MNIERVLLHNFRNFINVDEITFSPAALLVAAAPNATGKTNFLESLVMLLRGKSWRATPAECVRWEEEGFIIGGDVQRQGGSTTIAVRYHHPSRKMRVEESGVPASPITFYNHYPLILFLPEDTFLFARGPAQRRNFLNRVLVSQPAYVSALVQYQRVLKQRNTALKQASNPSDVAAWTELLVEHGLTLWSIRQQFVDFLATHLTEWYGKLSGEQQTFSVKLLATTIDRETFMKHLNDSFSYEQRYGYTLAGPHRDDIEITTNDNYPIATVLSQGQMRCLVLALKLSAHRFMATVTKEEPLLLLDEALSELDARRQELLLKHLPATQTLLTCTAIPHTVRQRDNVQLLDLRHIIAAKQPIAPLTKAVPSKALTPTSESTPATVATKV